MKTNYEVRYASSPDAVKQYDTEQLRSEFLIENLMRPDEVVLVYSHYDRYIAGSAVPVTNNLKLDTIDPLKSPYFLERRELGVINVGGEGVITVDGQSYELSYKDALYITMGSQEVSFSSNDPQNPAKFYLNSAPAHKAFTTKKITIAEAKKVELGSLGTSNHRVVNQMIVA
ncbi:MAG: 5-deoxy-glucuronate isomerase, partial [Marinoscillum sp.]